MRAIHFLKVDLCLTKMQNRTMWIFIIISIILSIGQGNPYWGPLYMVFCSMILSTTPFFAYQKSNSGFLLMLPATVKDRVVGRFGYGITLNLVSLLIGGIITVGVSIIGNKDIPYIAPFYIGIAAAGLIMLSLQYTLLYIIGNVKSQQLIGILRILPGFLFFFGGFWLVDFVNDYNTSENTEGIIKWMSNCLIWLCNHLLESTLIALLIGIIFFITGIFISVQVVKKRDFA